MIHTVYLSELTRKRLTDITQLQMCLLRYALFTKEISEASCAQYLNRYQRFRSRGEKIAKWAIGRRDSKRYELLEKFAQYSSSNDKNTSQQERQDKRRWCKQLHQQVWALHLNKQMHLERLYNKNEAPLWQIEAAEFLTNFYDYLSGDTKFPEYFFSEPGATSFGRQEFLKEFMKMNHSLYVCAVCDESGYYTVVKGNIRTEVDHYLPKSIYPHFACHPYNLIPICKICNQSMKNDEDPLETSGRRLHMRNAYFPYRSPGLNTQAYLMVQLERTEESVNWVKEGKLLPQRLDDFTVAQLIDTLERVYQIPHRWFQEGRADTIGETLFRRMRQFLGQGREGPLGFHMPSAIYNTLNQLLYYLHNEDQSKDPFAFAMTWTLVALLNEEYQHVSQEPIGEAKKDDTSHYPLIKELVDSLGQDIDLNEERALFAQNLLKLVRQAINQITH